MEFNYFSNQRLFFGPGKIGLLPELVKGYGERLLLITGKSSFRKSRHWEPLIRDLEGAGIDLHLGSIPGEPGPGDVDGIVETFRDAGISVVAAVGGGSVLDGGKAVAAMMCEAEPVQEFLEGVGTRTPGGKSLPFIAVPTTSGTGSEATKNAVISRTGEGGFKKSLRHDNFIPDIALVDPALTRECGPGITAACGMDAMTQLLEAFVSVKGSPMTHALCMSGLEGFGPALVRAVTDDPHDMAARSRLSYGAYLSGLALANAGLGAVHGFASVIGGMFDIPHGVVCGTLVGEITRENIRALEAKEPTHPALAGYGAAGFLLFGQVPEADAVRGCRLLMDGLDKWTDRLKIPRLGRFGMTDAHLLGVAEKTGQKNTPVKLPAETLVNILKKRL